MIRLPLPPRFLFAVVLAGCFTYFVIPPARVDTDQRLPATMASNVRPGACLELPVHGG
jgi:hypothetical protein